MRYLKEKQTAIEAVTKAASLCMRVRTDLVNLGTLEKGDKSPVTIADFGAQALVCQHLKTIFPHDPIVGEEDAGELRNVDNQSLLSQVTKYVRLYQATATPDEICDWIDAGNGRVANRFWTLDPIDGTKGFLRNDQYAIALALIEDDTLKVGVLACPALPVDLDDADSQRGALFVATQGEGAEMAPLKGGVFDKIQVSQAATQQNLRLVESVEAAHGNHALQEAIARAAGINQPALRMDSQAKYAAVARGDAVLYLRLPSPKYPGYREKIWDHAAGTLIVQEAGGSVTDMFGKPLDFSTDYKMNDNRGVAVSAGPFHEAVIAALADDQMNTFQ